MAESACASITVLAGTNGAGKSSVAGATLRANGGAYFNPDEAAKKIAEVSLGISQAQANIEAWNQGKRFLESAIEKNSSLAFETTLGGSTITALLEEAINAGIEVRMFFVGLASPELHIARVRARVATGGHDIPEEKIRERYHKSRLNLIRLLPKLTELLVYDNSAEADPKRGQTPRPTELLHMERGKVLQISDPKLTPDWAKPLLLAAIKTQRR